MKISYLIILFYLPSWLFSQADSTFQKEINIKQYVFPSTILLSGILLNGGPTKMKLHDKLPRTNTSFDDYLGFASMGIMYAADIAKIPSKNNAFNQTKYYIISNVFTTGIVLGLKEIVHVKRPDGSDKSFPSGHTAHAFVAGNVLFNEFIDTKPFIAYSGLIIASSTGFLRITNNKHWISDVLTSAGLATIITQLVYHYEPLKDWNPFRKLHYSVIPNIGNSQLGMVVIF